MNVLNVRESEIWLDAHK